MFCRPVRQTLTFLESKYKNVKTIARQSMQWQKKNLAIGEKLGVEKYDSFSSSVTHTYFTDPSRHRTSHARHWPVPSIASLPIVVERANFHQQVVQRRSWPWRDRPALCLCLYTRACLGEAAAWKALLLEKYPPLVHWFFPFCPSLNGRSVGLVSSSNTSIQLHSLSRWRDRRPATRDWERWRVLCASYLQQFFLGHRVFSGWTWIRHSQPTLSVSKEKLNSISLGVGVRTMCELRETRDVPSHCWWWRRGTSVTRCGSTISWSPEK